MTHVFLPLPASARFFGEYRVMRIGAFEFAYDLGLGQAIDLGREIELLLFHDREALQAVHVAQDDLAGGARSAHRHVDGGSGHRFRSAGLERTSRVSSRAGRAG